MFASKSDRKMFKHEWTEGTLAKHAVKPTNSGSKAIHGQFYELIDNDSWAGWDDQSILYPKRDVYSIIIFRERWENFPERCYFNKSCFRKREGHKDLSCLTEAVLTNINNKRASPTYAMENTMAAAALNINAGRVRNAIASGKHSLTQVYAKTYFYANKTRTLAMHIFSRSYVSLKKAHTYILTCVSGSRKTEEARKERIEADRQVRPKLADKEKENAALRQQLADLCAMNGMAIDNVGNEAN
mmetsp:Transcript_7620/g.12150  ORF Transcript_7620/g.12150 Transcript_7620/m.12150 type:complete len:243 (-) Transcript_7620:337-1065(-)